MAREGSSTEDQFPFAGGGDFPGDWAELDQIGLIEACRDWIYANTHVAARKSLLLSRDLFAENTKFAFDAFARNEGGYFCFEIALLLHRLYQRLDIESYVIGMGQLDMFTHATVVVPYQGKLVIQDPYLNFTLRWPDESLADYLDICRAAVRGRFPQVVRGPSRERVAHFEDDRGHDGRSWVGATQPRGQFVKLAPAHYRATVTMSVADLVYHTDYKSLLDWFVHRGLSAHACTLYLFPLIMVVGRKIYTKPSDHPTFSALFESCASIRKQAGVCR